MEVDVYVITQFAHPNGEKDAEIYEYISTTSADMGEIVAALQVLFPTMVGCQIEPKKPFDVEDA